MKKLLYLIILFFTFTQLFTLELKQTYMARQMNACFDIAFSNAISKAYPEQFIQMGFSSEEQKWYVDIKNKNVIGRFYVFGGKILPKKYFIKKNLYHSIFLDYYPVNIPDPKNFSEDYKKELIYLGNSSFRKNSLPSCLTLLQTFIYNARTEE